MLAASLFIFIALLLGSISKAFLFIRLSLKGMLNPSTKDLTKINSILRNKKYPKVFSKIFITILQLKIYFFVKRSAKKDKAIVVINKLILNTKRYYPKVVIRQKLAEILSDYDNIFCSKVLCYESPESKPIIDLLHNIIRLKAEMPLTLNAIEDKLIILIGNPIVNPEMLSYKVDDRLVDKIQWLFGPRQDFLQKILSIAA